MRTPEPAPPSEEARQTEVVQKVPVRQGLLFRVYLYATLMMALTFGTVFLVGSYILEPALSTPNRPATTWIVRHLDRLRGDRAEFDRQFRDLATTSEIQITYFDWNGNVLASNAPVLPAPLRKNEVDRLPERPVRYQDVTGVVALTENGNWVRYARVRVPEVDLHLGIPLTQLAVALVVIGLLSIPFARSVTAPLERLSNALRALGEGDFSVRTAIARADEIGATSRAFDEMASRIRATRASEKELLANVSHELRTPLARIRMALELIENEAGPPSAGRSARFDYWKDIEEDLVELEQFLDDIFTATRSDLAQEASGSVAPPLRIERVRLGAILAAAGERLHGRFPGRALEIDCPVNLPELDADPRLVRRALDNLLANAVKFSDESQSIRIEARHDVETDSLVILVVDSGRGISEENLAHVFEPFFRGEEDTTSGVGLGLVVVRRIVLAHGGTVSVASRLGEGTTFTVTIPVSLDGRRISNVVP